MFEEIYTHEKEKGRVDELDKDNEALKKIALELRTRLDNHLEQQKLLIETKNEEIAQKDQEVANLTAENDDLEKGNEDLINANESQLGNHEKVEFSLFCERHK